MSTPQEPKKPRSAVELAPLSKQFYVNNWGLLLTVFLVIYVFVKLWSVVAPFVAAFALAYLLASPGEWLHLKLRKKVPLPICSILMFLLVLTVLAGFGLLFIPVISAEIELVRNNLPELLSTLKRTVQPWLKDALGVRVSFDQYSMRTGFGKFFAENQDVFADFSTKIFKVGSKLTGFFTMMIVATFFLLAGWKQIATQSRMLIPPHLQRRAAPIIDEIDTVIGEYIKGMFIVVLCLSTYYAIGLSIAGLQGGWAIGILSGILIVVPYLGILVAMTLALLTAALELQGLFPVLMVLLVFGIGQIIEGFVLTPLVVGDKIGLSPLSVIFALAFFGFMFGLVGFILALPLAAVFKVGYNHLVAWYKNTDYYQQGLE